MKLKKAQPVLLTELRNAVIFWLKKLGLNGEDIAFIMNLDRSTINRVLRGKKHKTLGRILLEISK